VPDTPDAGDPGTIRRMTLSQLSRSSANVLPEALPEIVYGRTS
jgi:hypothetical protein